MMAPRRGGAPRYEDLAEEQLAALPLNGCGGKGGWFDPPELAFHECCQRHDYAYWVGGTEADRRAADRRFLLDMVGNAERFRGFRFAFHVSAAVLYYLAVRCFGRKFFRWGTKATRRDLEEQLELWRARTNPRPPSRRCR